MLKRYTFIGIILLLGAVVFAQEATPEPEITPEAEVTEASNSDEMCPALVTNALDLTQRNCSATGSNEACYGYIFIDAALRTPNTQFSQPGDILDVINIESLQLSPLDTNSGQWGVIVMSVEANLADRTQNVNDDVQIVLFGDTELRDASQFIEVIANTTVNVRANPRTDAGVISSLATGDSIIANGRLEDNSWIRVRVNDAGEIGLGWISADFLEANAELELLPPITREQAENPSADDLAVQYGPMQAFIFESAEDDSPCEQAPNSGMLIQTPDGAASVTLWLDEVVIQLDGTGVISAQADGNLTVGVIDGTAQVEANGGVSTAIAGQAVDVALDSELVPIEAPSVPRPIEGDEVQALPVDLLNDPVTVPLVDDNNTASNILATASGDFQWRFSYNSAPPYICSDGSEIILESAGIAPTISAEADAIVVSGLRFAEATEGVYRANYVDGSNNLIQDTLQVVASDRIIGDRTIDFAQPVCTLNVSFSIQLSAP